MADNLGFNLALALTGHSASYFCRICELLKEFCQQATVKVLSKYRSSKSYQCQLDFIDNCGVKFNLRDTCDVVRYCKLNDLAHFKIVDNLFVDIMHDLTKSVIPLVLKNIFEYCFNANIFKFDDCNMCNFYSYPKAFRTSKPSSISKTRQHFIHK